MPTGVQAGGGGLLSGAALLVGAAIGYRARRSGRAVAAVMAFGSGVLISAVAFELLDEAHRQGGFAATALVLLAGAALFSAANFYLSRRGAVLPPQTPARRWRNVKTPARPLDPHASVTAQHQRPARGRRVSAGGRRQAAAG